MRAKPTPIDLVPYADLLGDSREFLRVWAKEDGPVTCFINPVPIGADPFAFGRPGSFVIPHENTARGRWLAVPGSPAAGGGPSGGVP